MLQFQNASNNIKRQQNVSSRSRVYATDWVYAELGCWRNPPAAQQRFDLYGMLARGHYHCLLACNGEED